MADTPPDNSRDDNAAVTNRLGTDQAGRPSSTYLPDWVWMHPDAPDQAKVYFWAVRAFIFEKDSEHTYEVSDAELASFLNRSPKSVGRARTAAEKAGFITSLGEKTRSTYSKGIKHQAPVVRVLRVNIDPPPEYAGPVNCFDERRAIRSRERAGHNGRTDLPSRHEQGNVDNSPNRDGHNRHGRTDVSTPKTDVSEPWADVSESTVSTQGERAPQVAFTSSPSQDSPSPYVVESPHERPCEPDDGIGTTQPEPDSHEGEGDPPPKNNTTATDWQQERARSFLRSVVGQVPPELATTLNDDVKFTIRDLVLQAWRLGIGNATIRDELTNTHGTKDLAKAWPAKLQKLIDNVDITAGRSLNACSRCQARTYEPVVARTVLEDPTDAASRVIPCPTCRPDESPTSITKAGAA